MEDLRERVEALERQQRRVNRRLRHWRGLAGLLGILLLALLPLRPGGAQDALPLADRVAALEARIASLQAALEKEQADRQQADTLVQGQIQPLADKLVHLRREGNDLYISGANLHLINGMGATNGSPEVPNSVEPALIRANGLGNLIIGYNELRGSGDNRSGSHNLVVGAYHNFSSIGGLVTGRQNSLAGPYSVLVGGRDNTAGGTFAVISGGRDNTAPGFQAVVIAGNFNVASGTDAAVMGGIGNNASGAQATVSGGARNVASGAFAAVGGGLLNTAGGGLSTVGGGQQIIQNIPFGWAAGSEAAAASAGNFRSP